MSDPDWKTIAKKLSPLVPARDQPKKRRGPSRKWSPPPSRAGWLNQYESPLGKRRHMTLCKQGVFPSASKEGKLWLIPQIELDAYITRAKKPKSAETEDIDRELAKLGF